MSYEKSALTLFIAHQEDQPHFKVFHFNDFIMAKQCD